MGKWYSRPVISVSDLDRAKDFYVGRLGFKEVWRHAEEGKTLVAQVERDGCELILSSQWPERLSKAVMFVSLEGKDVNPVRAQLERNGVNVREGWWGYPLIVLEDPDGNELWIPTNDAE